MTSVRIRSAGAGDAPAIAAIYAPNVAGSAISFETVPPSAEEMQRRITSVQRHTPWLVCEIDERVSGYAYVSQHRERAAYRWSLDAAVYVSADRQRRGIGRGLYTALFELARLQGYYAVHAGITLPNLSSIALHEALGFQAVGVYRAVGYKEGAWRDVGWWQLALCERRSEPAVPLLPEQARARDPGAWADAVASGERLLSR